MWLQRLLKWKVVDRSLGEKETQRLLNHARWDADLVRDALRAQVAERLGDAGGVLVVDDTGLEKKGRLSAGTQRQ
ncbi:hypothetical protein D0T12_13535 [Actinomadura spongiicola]|uniref:Transposase IS701-like DDE domain-containing protein n=1 Tax=Actinomadura spongiicola TaxID=2303421 RepID=A0A372GGR5_9ACTN|nr:hypothetical protein D0T12_13535 [Actinomadura spongiicola]